MNSSRDFQTTITADDRLTYNNYVDDLTWEIKSEVFLILKLCPPNALVCHFKLVPGFQTCFFYATVYPLSIIHITIQVC